MLMSRSGWHVWTAILALGGFGFAPPALVQAQGTTVLPTILVVGDSLSAEYGLQRGSGWVALLATHLAKEHPEASVVNASISGDTTSGGLARLPALLRQHQPTLVVLELGGNDALRGLPVARCVIDGELLVPVGKTFSFDELLMRIHPAATRVAKLARERPAVFVAFDLLVDDRGRSLVDLPLSERRTRRRFT